MKADLLSSKGQAAPEQKPKVNVALTEEVDPPPTPLFRLPPFAIQRAQPYRPKGLSSRILSRLSSYAFW
jgi:hypothetical protein